MKFWWVNHRQTHKQEVGGGYIWSPKIESDGKRSQYYDNMRLTRSGDSILSYADGAIQAIGKITNVALTASRPEEFGKIGSTWADYGWLVPVAWSRIPPLKPKSILKQIAPLLPSKYSPLRAETGDGNQKAYLTEISKQLFDLITSAAGVSWSELEQVQNEMEVDFREALDDAEEKKLNADLTLSDTEREQLAKARRGQGLFRKNLCAIEAGCRLSGINTTSLLVASHIKPWRSCATAQERLDGNNGLLLAPHVDYLFDRGLISFDEDGSLLISSSLKRTDLALLGLPSNKSNVFNVFQQEYLRYHRETVFQA